MKEAAGVNTPTVMRLRIALLGVKPAPWPRIEVLTSTTLAGLHEMIQAVMGWEDLHLHCFRILGRRYDGEQADLTGIRLADLRLVGGLGMGRGGQQRQGGGGGQQTTACECHGVTPFRVCFLSRRA